MRSSVFRVQNGAGPRSHGLEEPGQTQSTLTPGLGSSFCIVLLWEVRELHPQMTGVLGFPLASHAVVAAFLGLGSALHFSESSL